MNTVIALAIISLSVLLFVYYIFVGVYFVDGSYETKKEFIKDLIPFRFFWTEIKEAWKKLK